MVIPGKVERILIIICLGFLSLTVLKVFYFSHKSGGGDLRSRIVASRMLFTDKSPYFYKWQPGESDYFLDPNNHFDWPVNTNVSTPAELLIIHPVSILPYIYVRYVWVIMEMLAAAITLLLVFKHLKHRSAMLFLLIAVGLLASDIYMYHAERGQKYIFYALGLAIIFAIKKSRMPRSALLAGIISGLFVFFRPFMGVLLFAFLIMRKWNLALGWAIGMVAGLLIFVLPFAHLWQEYVQSMSLWEQLFLGEDVLIKNPTIFPIPDTVEGMRNITVYSGFNIDYLSSIPAYLEEIGIRLSSVKSIPIFCVLTAAATWTVYGSFRNLRLRHADLPKTISAEVVFVFGFLIYLIAELSFPLFRNGYGLVQWLFALPIVVTHFRNNYAALSLIFTAFLLFHNFPFYFPFQAMIAEFILIFYTLRYLKHHLSPQSTPVGVNRMDIIPSP